MDTMSYLLHWQPKTYQEAWEVIKRMEQVSLQEAMQLAQDRFPQLFKEFLANCPRGKI